MSAERLQEAADRLDALASKASPGVWRHTERGIEAGEYDDVLVPGPVSCMSYCYGGSSTLDGDRIDLDGAYIATMHPGVGKALAMWLRFEADQVRHTYITSAELAPALAVADAILGGAA